MTSRRTQRGGVLLWLLLLLAAVCLTIYLVRVPLLRAVADWWIVDEPPQKAQAIVVLGGDNAQGDRIHHAVALYRAGWAPRLVLSGGPIRSYFNEARLMEREAVDQGVPDDHLILAPQKATSTLQEALDLRPVLAQHGFRKIIVVTSNVHTRRARRIFHTVYRERGTEVIFSAAPDSNFDPQRWWEQREGRAALGLEMLKMVYTWWELWNLPAVAAFGPPSAPGLWLPAGEGL